MADLIIGMGEIGNAVHDLVEKAECYDIKAGTWPFTRDFEVLHICFPYSDNFLDDVSMYCANFKPKHTIIWSTVPIGITKLLRAVHTPVEGKHPDLALSIRLMERWIGCNDTEEGLYFTDYFQTLGLRTRIIPNSDFTEALKLLSTTEYGINIEFARYKAHVADSLNMDYELTKEWNREYNKLYKNLGYEKEYQKFVLDAPEGPKGGHCVTPNAVLLEEQFPNELVKIVGEL